VTAFASTAVAIKKQFDSHFPESVNVLLNLINANQGPLYKQLRAQIIEALTLISGEVSDDVFISKA
jgi:hypothetical protein